MAPSKKTLSKSAQKQAKGKSVKKVASTGSATKAVKKAAPKKATPARPLGGKKATPARPVGGKKAAPKKVVKTPLKQKAKASHPSVTKASPKKSGKAVVKAKKVVTKSSPVKKNKVAVKSLKKVSRAVPVKKTIKTKAKKTVKVVAPARLSAGKAGPSGGKKVNALPKKKVKTVAAKTPLKQKTSSPVKSATKGRAVKPARPSGGKIASTPSISSGTAATKAVKDPAPKKAGTPKKAGVTKKVSTLKKAEEKNTEPKASEVEVKIDAELPVVPPIEIHGEDLHFIPEHNATTPPLTPQEAHEKEIVFHHKEEVAFHQKNQKVRDALPSRKTMKKFYRNKGGRK